MLKIKNIIVIKKKGKENGKFVFVIGLNLYLNGEFFL